MAIKDSKIQFSLKTNEIYLLRNILSEYEYQYNICHK